MPETSFTTLTVQDAEIFEPSVALTVITAVPLDFAVTLPSCVTVATASLFDDHASVLLLASEETIAVSCADCPSLRVISVSLKTIPETNLTTFTVQDADILEPSVEVAVIMAVPLDIAVTLPWEETVATDSLLLVHTKVLLLARSGVTVAVKVADCPSFSVISDSLNTIPDTSLITLTLQDADTLEPSVDFAVMIADPW